MLPLVMLRVPLLTVPLLLSLASGAYAQTAGQGDASPDRLDDDLGDGPSPVVIGGGAEEEAVEAEEKEAAAEPKLIVPPVGEKSKG